MTESTGTEARALVAGATGYAVAKRTIDVALSAIGLLVLATVLPVIALLIKLDSKGPILFRQVRVGRGFRSFKVYKFRTMVTDARQADRLLTVGEDPRITRVGRFLRTTKLDEFPQLINVLKGDMSLVGPRPEVPKYVEMFRGDFERILRVRPGATDPATFKYRNEAAILARSEDPEREYIERILPDKIRIANDYIDRAGLRYDLTIMLRTLIEAVWGQILPLRIQVLRHSRPLVVGIHVFLTVAANYAAFWLRFDGAIPADEVLRMTQFLPWLVLCRAAAFVPFRLYEGLWRYTSLWDLRNIVGGVVSSSLLFYVLVRSGLGDSAYPRSVFLIDALIAVAAMGGVRLVYRVYGELVAARPSRRILVIGAGDVGEMVVRELRKGDEFSVIGFIDDDKGKTGRSIHGVAVLGTAEDLPRVMVDHRPHEILVAISQGDSARLRRIVRSLEHFKVPIKIAPHFRDVEAPVSSNGIRNLTIEDLLPRASLDLDDRRVGELITGRRVVVTGCGGTIGSELARQIAAHSPAALVLLDRSESGLRDVLQSLSAPADASLIPVVCDVTHERRVENIFEQHRPDLVFHAAAHTHAALMENDPCEAVHNNVRGTRVVRDACVRHGVDRFVLLSTHLAIDPTSVLGATRRVAEMLVQQRTGPSRPAFVVVRFGSVFNGRSGIVSRLLDQIKAGGPVTVEHEGAERPMMRAADAVQLVLHATGIDPEGGTFALDMGEQLNLRDVARDLIRLAGLVPGEDAVIAFSGLGPGEKLSESLASAGETLQHSGVEKIRRVYIPGGRMSSVDDEIRTLERLSASGDGIGAVRQLWSMVPTFDPSPEWRLALGVPASSTGDPATHRESE